ncbi:DUF5682 family protein [Streptomyces sp. NBC_01498]|uniref:DUF5682 family protein n=1 Tax=Streptomyces sp. NBC_01498 TaxID=2975870 RepID=UPI002E7C51E8|nr:DUF5682 family protein [Streptomyces sp. NBC_01498]WTL25073.1 DUF5682 family protein [Streptomyces sp. NBC_01498]
MTLPVRHPDARPGATATTGHAAPTAGSTPAPVGGQVTGVTPTLGLADPTADATHTTGLADPTHTTGHADPTAGATPAPVGGQVTDATPTPGAGPAWPAAGGPLLLGVRHHGPGSARAVRAALDAASPSAVLIEGPPEGDALVPLAADPAMRPPVALLAHAVDDPGHAAFWPLAEFSPEWVAIRWSLAHDVPVRFIDLPATHSLAFPDDRRDDEAGVPEADEGTPDGARAHDRSARALRIDPLAVLAEAAGYDDAERWWEDVVEHRGGAGDDPFAPFAAVGEAMGALREEYGDGGHRRDLVREAYMRLQLRSARKEFGDDRVAVVCGAWHVPALGARTTATADRALLKGLPKTKCELTWVPWTHQRLARHSGYGAGIDSPGWYGHLFGAPDRPVARWMTKVAGLLREEDRPVSSAHVIEAVRLAETLATLRGRPLAGLTETTDAIRAVMCDGSDVPLALIRDRLVVGDVLGEVPDSAPVVPLQRDLTRLQRSLRLKPEAQERELDLDLRKETDTGRSRMLHRLRLLGIGWGEPAAGRGSTGTFRESWRLRWEPELYVRVAEAGVWGTTVLSAATAKAESRALSATALSEVTSLAEQCLLAELTDALPVVMKALADRAALDADVAHLAQALPALARSLRYGDVRSTDTAALGEVAAGLAERICVALPPACAALDADGAAEMRGHLDNVHTAIGLLPDTPGRPAGDLAGRWGAVLRALAARDTVPGVVRGRSARLLLDDGRLPEDEAARLMGLALSPGTPPADAAAWIEGFLGGASGGGLLLVHDERLLALVDTWLTGVPDSSFTGVLPLLRRTFSAYEPGVRRTLGELVRRGPAGDGARPGPATAGIPGFGTGVDEARADAVLPVLRLLLETTPATTGTAADREHRNSDNDLAGVAR